MGMSSRSIKLDDGQRFVLTKKAIFPFSLLGLPHVYNIIFEDGHYIIIYCQNNEIVVRVKLQPNTTYYRSISDANRHSLESEGFKVGDHDIPWMYEIVVNDNNELQLHWDELGYTVTEKIIN